MASDPTDPTDPDDLIRERLEANGWFFSKSQKPHYAKCTDCEVSLENRRSWFKHNIDLFATFAAPKCVHCAARIAFGSTVKSANKR